MLHPLITVKAQQGTKLFWSTATAALAHRGERFTLAAVPVTCNRMADVLAALWPQLEKSGVKVRRLLLDRGFYGAEVVAWLQAHGVSFLMPMIRRGRTPRRGNQGTGTAPFFVRGRTGLTSYTWRQRNRGRFVTVRVAMVPLADRRRRPLVFVFGGRLSDLDYCRRLYKKRFGIETSYRQAKQSRAGTTSRNERWRRLLIVLSFVLRNVWLWDQRQQPPPPRRLRLTYRNFLDQLAITLILKLAQLPGTT